MVRGKGVGLVAFVGEHRIEGTPRVGVILRRPLGKNDGVVGGHRYFSCARNHGVLCKPDRVVPHRDNHGIAGPGPASGRDPACDTGWVALPALPVELWLLVCSFVRRRDWEVPSVTERLDDLAMV